LAQWLADRPEALASPLGQLVVSEQLSGATGAARTYGLTAGALTGALAVAGLLTYGFFALASHSLDTDEYGQVVVLWSVVFVVVSVLFRPVEQLISRTIAERDAHGQPIGQAVRIAGLIQLGLAATFVAAAFAFRGPIQDDLLEGQEFLFYVLVGAVTAFAAEFFARGFLAGSRRFGLFSALLLLDGCGRLAFALAVAVGIANGVDAVALGVVAGPTLSLAVVPFAVRARHRNPPQAAPAPAGEAGPRPDLPEFTLAHGGGFAAAVLVVTLSEQIFLNGGPLFARAEEGAAAAGFIFNTLMVARAPVVLFQAVAASLLPHLTRLRSTGGESSEEAFRLSVRLTIAVIAALAALAVLVVLVAGPQLMQILFGDKFTYDRLGLVLVATAMGFYLSAATLNQAALAQGQARRAAACWATCAIGFIVWNLTGALDVFRRVEVGYLGAAVVLCLLLYLVYRRPRPVAQDLVDPGSARELEARLAAADEAG
jgi:O-antigen/teichoic acid export membrane protein